MSKMPRIVRRIAAIPTSILFPSNPPSTREAIVRILDLPGETVKAFQVDLASIWTSFNGEIASGPTSWYAKNDTKNPDNAPSHCASWYAHIKKHGRRAHLGRICNSISTPVLVYNDSRKAWLKFLYAHRRPNPRYVFFSPRNFKTDCKIVLFDDAIWLRNFVVILCNYTFSIDS